MVKSLTNPFRGQPLPLGSLITAAGQRLSAQLDAALQTAGFADLRASHAAVFMAIDPEGTRLTDIATRCRMTKQAAGELTGYLTRCGYLQISAGERDRRTRVVSMTPRGWDAIAMGQRVITEFDAWLDATVGHTEVQQLREILNRIADIDSHEQLTTPGKPE